MVSKFVVKIQSIPAELKALPRWMVWRESIKKGKSQKPPHNARLGCLADATDESNWCSFEEAVAALNDKTRNPPFDGLTFVLNGDGIVGIDLDDCRNPETKTTKPWAVEIIKRFASYTELSPSGCGYRIFVRGSIPPYGNTKAKEDGKLEVYDTKKPLTVTGQMITAFGAGKKIEDRSEELIKWHQEEFPQPSTVPTGEITGSVGDIIVRDPPLIDDDKLQKLLTKKTKAKPIWEGDWSGYASQSEAELALANYAAYAGWTDQEIVDLLVGARLNASLDKKHDDYYMFTLQKVRATIPFVPKGKINGINGINQCAGDWNEGEVDRPIQLIPLTLIPPVMGEDAYQGKIGEFIRSVMPYTEATGPAILAHLLPALGTLIGPGPYLWAGSEQRCRINTVLVGPTGRGRKGTALVPVDLLMRKIDERWWARQKMTGLATGEGLIAAVADSPVNPDGSQEVTDKRVYVVEEELSKVLAQMKRDGNILSQVVRECYDSGNLSVMTRGNPLRASGAHISVTGHITGEELREKLNKLEMSNGWGNRFAWFISLSEKMLPLVKPIPDDLLEGFANHFRVLNNYAAGAWSLAEDVAEVWAQEVYPHLWNEQPGLFGSMTVRGASFVMRLALIYAVADSVGQYGRIGKGRVIKAEHLEAAVEVWSYCLESCRQLFPQTALRAANDTPAKILSLLSSGPMKKAEFTDHINKPVSQIDRHLAALEKEGRVRKKTEKKGKGRPAEVWELVPQEN